MVQKLYVSNLPFSATEDEATNPDGDDYYDTGITIIDEDPNQRLFDELINILKVIDLQQMQLNLIFWYYQLRLLDLQGFKTDLTNNLPGLDLPDPNKGPNSKNILSTLLSGLSLIHI